MRLFRSGEVLHHLPGERAQIRLAGEGTAVGIAITVSVSRACGLSG